MLTNVAVVKLKKQNKVFELACYPNKIAEWRAKQETDIGQVLQIEQIFSDVERGITASNKDLKKFGNNMSRDDVIIEILNKGEFQMSETERDDKLEKVKLDIANIISKECVNSEDGNAFPVSIIMRAMKELNCKFDIKKNTKPQALAIINEIKSVLPIQRARMHIRLKFTSNDQAEMLLKSLSESHSDEFKMDLQTVQEESTLCYLTIEKSMYRVVQDTLKKGKKAYSKVEVEILDKQTFETALEFSKQ